MRTLLQFGNKLFKKWKSAHIWPLIDVYGKFQFSSCEKSSSEVCMHLSSRSSCNKRSTSSSTFLTRTGFVILMYRVPLFISEPDVWSLVLDSFYGLLWSPSMELKEVSLDKYNLKILTVLDDLVICYCIPMQICTP